MKTNIIITKAMELNEQVIEGLLKEYDYPEQGIEEVTPGVYFGTVEGIKVGYEFILTKNSADADYTVVERRRNIEGLAINHSAVVIKGDNFKRIGCIQTQEELDGQIKQTEMIRDIDKKTAADNYQKALDKAKADYDRTIARLDADAQAKIDRFNAEFTAYQNNDVNYIIEDTEEVEEVEDTEE